MSVALTSLSIRCWLFCGNTPLGYRASTAMLARCTHCHIILKAYGLPTLSSHSLIGFGLVYVMHIWFTRDTL